MNWNAWKRFLFGTPERVTVVSGIFTAIIILIFFRGLLAQAVEVVVNEIVAPIAKLLILIALLVWGFKKILGSVGIASKKRRH